MNATTTSSGQLAEADRMPDWAMAAIRNLNNLLAEEVRDSRDFFAVAPPPPPPAPVIIVTAPPPPPPEESDGVGLDQAQDVASDTALDGGLAHNAVGVADQAAQGLGQHGTRTKSGSSTRSSRGGRSSTSTTSGGSRSSASSASSGNRGRSGTRGRRPQ